MDIEHNSDNDPENMDDEKKGRIREILHYLFGDTDTLPEGIELMEVTEGEDSRRVLFRADDEDGNAVASRALDAIRARHEKAQEVAETAAPVEKKRESNVTESTVDTIEDDVVKSLNIVNIKTEAFSAPAFGFYALPGMRVMSVLAMDEMKKMPEMIGLLQSALLDPKKSAALELLNFGELGEVLSNWIEVSQPDYEKTILRGFRR